jgi:hypothetical protein
MKKIALTNQKGKWFDRDTATLYTEKTFHNGQNYISKVTGSQFEHESLYVSKRNTYILNHYSDYLGSSESYVEISKTTAAAWFACQGFAYCEVPSLLFSEIEELEV